jgi:uridylate kinase
MINSNYIKAEIDKLPVEILEKMQAMIDEYYSENPPAPKKVYSPEEIENLSDEDILAMSEEEMGNLASQLVARNGAKKFVADFDNNGNLIVDKNEFPEVYDWVVNG